MSLSPSLLVRRAGTVRALVRCAAGAVALASLAALAACGNSSSSSIDVNVANADRCDPLDTRHCLLPFPSDTFTVDDPRSDTGKRIHFVLESMPTNDKGVQVDPTEWNRNDGFSPGSAIATFVPGVDLAKSGIAQLTDIAASLDADAPVVLLDATTGQRWPYWAELDASVPSDDDRVLYVRPAVNLKEGHRYVVGLRNLKDSSGTAIEAGAVFRAYRDDLNTHVPEIEVRRARYEQVLRDLGGAGVRRDQTLFLAWDFTVASERNLTERLLHIRDDAFAALGSASPAFTVTEVLENVDEFVARRVKGTFSVPNYLTGSGEPGSRFNYAGADLPQRNGTFTAPFECIVPRVAIASSDPNAGVPAPARPSLYGHGLLGSNDEVEAGNVRRMANEHDFVFCATKWAGMSEDDIANAAAILQDLSKFPTLADRLQQGVLNTLFLGRLMIHPGGLSTHPAFQNSGAPLIDTTELYYDGNSQGGIMGGITTAVSIDFTRAVLGVTGMNYSTLLQRSVDWETYRLIYDPSYPEVIERGIGLSLLQMLWDRGEANGYALHMTSDPLPNTPAHEVLMHVAFGDWQVSNATAEVEARTIGASIHTPTVADGRLPTYVTPYWNIPAIPSYPFDGSAMVVWDSGLPPEPTVNLAPTGARDSHEDPRNSPLARQQKSEFLRPNGVVIDPCGGLACTAPPA